jgi:DinB superfamily
MEHPIPGRPADSEVASWALKYVNLVEGDDLIGALTTQRAELIALLARLDGATRYEPAKWSVCEVLGHIIDTERIFVYRTLCVARGEQAPLPPFDQDEYMATAGFASRALADLTVEFEVVRESSLRLLRGFPADAWMRHGTVNGCDVTTRGLAFIIAGHEKHHSRILRDKYVIG